MSGAFCSRCGHESHPPGDCAAGVWPADQSGPLPCRCDPAWFEVFVGPWRELVAEAADAAWEQTHGGRP